MQVSHQFLIEWFGRLGIAGLGDVLISNREFEEQMEMERVKSEETREW
jgi:hypothetical protein